MYNRNCCSKKLRESSLFRIPKCKILGVNIAAINMRWLVKFTRNNIDKLSGKYMCVSNVHTTVMAYENKNYRDIQNNAVMAIPDGGPLSYYGRRKGFHNMKRTTGPSYLENVLFISKQKKYRHFFYGSTKKTLRKLRHSLKRRFPEINIVGMYSPPFRTLSEREDKKIISIINAAKPDFVWVGLGAPKQEMWMAEHESIIHGFMVGVGAAFDYLSGNIKRAPKWMQDNNLEWLYRLFQEPKRLFKRYAVTNTKFIYYCFRDKRKF